MALSEEEKLARRREYGQRYREANRERERERVRRWAKENPEKQRQKDRRWNQANREKCRERNRQWRTRNPDKVRACNKRYKDAHQDENREGVRRWREENPDRARAQVATRRARKVSAIPEGVLPVTGRVLSRRRALFGGCCCYCGGPGPLHTDHFLPLARGGHHAPNNLVPACESCNLSKAAKAPEAWYLSQPFFRPERWERILRHTSGSDVQVVQLSLLDVMLTA